MFRRRDPDTELERRLAAERPQPPDELVRRFARLRPERAARRATIPRIAVIVAVTGGLALSLGVAGAIGSASGSIHAFSRGVVHLVQAPSTAPPTVTSDHNQGGAGGILGPSDPRWWSHRQFESGPPFGQQYAHLIPICWHGQIIWVTPFEYLWYFIHGASPARDCVLRR